jgi:ABC-2 type transport system ATP-binding protein
VVAVDGAGFEVHRGELFGLLGPNGAGKTTTINMLTGLARPDSGSVEINGIDCVRRPKAAQRHIGVVPDESNLYPELTGFENLCFCGALYGMRKRDRVERAGELLDEFGLQDAAERRFAGYSRGMKRRLAIAAGIIHEPPILFLDEPTTGIDVTGAGMIRRLIEGLHSSGTTILLTTHYIEEAERLCDRVAFMVRGRITDVDRVDRLIQTVRDRQVLEVSCTGLPSGIVERLRDGFPGLVFEPVGRNAVRVESDNTVPVGPLVRFFEENGAEVTEARKLRRSLEDVFVRITGIEAAAMRGEKEKKGGSS